MLSLWRFLQKEIKKKIKIKNIVDAKQKLCVFNISGFIQLISSFGLFLAIAILRFSQSLLYMQ